jgi:hypothetical protein
MSATKGVSHRLVRMPRSSDSRRTVFTSPNGNYLNHALARKSEGDQGTCQERVCRLGSQSSKTILLAQIPASVALYRAILGSQSVWKPVRIRQSGSLGRTHVKSPSYVCRPHENLNFSSTYSESSIIRSAICSACMPAKFLSTNSLTKSRTR